MENINILIGQPLITIGAAIFLIISFHISRNESIFAYIKENKILTISCVLSLAIGLFTLFYFDKNKNVDKNSKEYIIDNKEKIKEQQKISTYISLAFTIIFLLVLIYFNFNSNLMIYSKLRSPIMYTSFIGIIISFIITIIFM